MPAEKCRKCELIIGSEAERACQVVGCPRRTPTTRALAEVIKMSAQIAAEGIVDHAQFGKFTTKIIAEILLGNLDVETARAVAVFSRQLLDSINTVAKSGKHK